FLVGPACTDTPRDTESSGGRWDAVHCHSRTAQRTFPSPSLSLERIIRMHHLVTRRVAVAAACLLPLAAMAMPAHSVAAPRAATTVHAPLKVGVVLDVGGLDDKGFNHMAYLGAQAAQKKYGITFKYVQTTATSDALYYANLATFARQGYDLVFGIGFLMEPSIYKVAKAYPKVHFAIVDGAPTDAKGNTVNLPNVANLFFREQESGYLV